MSREAGNEKILALLRPYAANWSGTLKRGDVVIPSEDLTKLVEQLAALVADPATGGAEASEIEVFEVLRAASRSASLQTQAAKLRQAFLIQRRPR